MSNGITEFFSPEILVGPLLTSTVFVVSLTISTKISDGKFEIFEKKFDKLESNMVNMKTSIESKMENQEKIFNLKFENLEKNLETLGKKVEILENTTGTNTKSNNELKSRLDSSSSTLTALVSIGTIFTVINMIPK